MKGQGTIVATGAIGYPPGLGAVGARDRRREGDDDDVDVRPSHHPGRRVRPVPAGGRGSTCRASTASTSRSSPTSARSSAPHRRRRAPAAGGRGAPRAEPAAAAGRGASPSEELLQAVQAATSLIKAHRTHGHLAARLDPLGSEPEGDPALDPEPLGLTPEIMAQIPAKILRTYVPGATLADALPHLRETYCGTIAYEIEHIASHRQRMWLREKIESGAFRAPLTARREAHAAAPPHAGRLARALHAQGLPGPEAVLDRGPGHDRPDARRDDPARGRRTARARSCSAWRTAAGSTCSPTTSAARTRRSSASSRAPRRSRP